MPPSQVSQPSFSSRPSLRRMNSVTSAARATNTRHRNAKVRALEGIRKTRGSPRQRRWVVPRRNAALLPNKFAVHGSIFGACAHLDQEVARLLTLVQYRAKIEKEMTALEAQIDAIDRKAKPLDEDVSGYFRSLKTYYPGMLPTVTSASQWSANNWHRTVPNTRASTNERFENRWKAMTASVMGLLQVYARLEPLDAERAHVNEQYAKLSKSLEQVNRHMNEFAGRVRGCLPLGRTRNGVTYLSNGEENMR